MEAVDGLGQCRLEFVRATQALDRRVFLSATRFCLRENLEGAGICVRFFAERHEDRGGLRGAVEAKQSPCPLQVDFE